MSADYNIVELLPHDPPMVLLDQYVSSTETELVAQTDIRPDSQFFSAGNGVPAYIGIEYIAQAVSAFNGLQDKKTGKAVQPGFLLGSRKVELFTDYFALGTTLDIQVVTSFNDGEMAVFDGLVSHQGDVLVKARINAFIKTAQSQMS
jgi:predicted hotdog family 3-hydroxylacyl-ACP dehydratase